MARMVEIEIQELRGWKDEVDGIRIRYKGQQ